MLPWNDKEIERERCAPANNIDVTANAETLACFNWNLIATHWNLIAHPLRNYGIICILYKSMRVNVLSKATYDIPYQFLVSDNQKLFFRMVLIIWCEPLEAVEYNHYQSVCVCTTMCTYLYATGGTWKQMRLVHVHKLPNQSQTCTRTDRPPGWGGEPKPDLLM